MDMFGNLYNHTGARPILKSSKEKKVTDVFGEFHTDINDNTREVELRIIFSIAPYYRTGTCA
jgi:hypothetical protein